MKIILATGIYPPDAGGPATYTKGMSDFLRAEGHEVVVVTYGDRAKKKEGENSKWLRIISRDRNLFIRHLAFAWQVFREARSADLIYAQGPVASGLPAMISARLTGTDIVMKVVGDYAWERAMQKGETRLLDDYLASKPRGILNRIERWTAKRAKKIIVPSQYLKTVVERWGVPGERISVVKNASDIPSVDLSVISTEMEKSLLFEKGSLDYARDDGMEGRDDGKSTDPGDEKRKVVFLTAMRAVPWKGVTELIEWWSELPESCELIVAGDGPELSKWKTLVEQKRLQDRIRFLGHIPHDEMKHCYETSDAFLLHSGYEGYAHVIPEAISFGLPCFVSDKGGNPETAEDYPSHVTVLPYQDRSAWVSTLASFVPDPEKRSTPCDMRMTGEMFEETRRILFMENEPAHVVMVSFETQLQEKESLAYARIRSMLSDRLSISALLISKGAGDVDYRDADDVHLRIFSWHGGSLRRSLFAIREGIREAKRVPERTVISAQDPFIAGFIGYVISRWTNSPLEIQEHADFYSGYWRKESLKNRAFSLLGRFLLRRAERVRVVSERIQKNIVRLGVDPAKIEVIPVSQELYFGECLKSQKDLPRFIAPCRFVRQKGLDTLLEAMAILKGQNVHFQLDLIGEGPEEDTLQSFIKEKNLQDCVRVLPWMTPTELWKDADLFILSSRYEGWGRTIVEAMAYGVPIVTTDVGCVGSFFRPQIDGRVVPPNNALALADAIREQCNEHDRRIVMCRSAQARAKELSTKDVLHEQQRVGWRCILDR
ncbi:MAG: glycosyltransferase, partial [bacterium]|nr:glycosyltransferase [bacterium]